MKLAIALTAVLIAGCTQVDAEPAALSGTAQTQWHDMRPIERGWVGGQVITAAMGPYGRPDDANIVEMRAAVAPGTELVGVCGYLQKRNTIGLFVAVYDPATLTVTGEATYRLQDNIMPGGDFQTPQATFSKMDRTSLERDCQILGIMGK